MKVEEYFEGKGCVVTGAASGIGFALTKALLQAGAVVFMADRDYRIKFWTDGDKVYDGNYRVRYKLVRKK